MKPILFNTEMVRAILEGRKTVTRRVVKPQPNSEQRIEYCEPCNEWTLMRGWALVDKVINPPYRPGDILYVRETWAAWSRVEGVPTALYYKADGDVPDGIKWRPSIHMPRVAARIFLRVKDVRVERLQDITEEQAQKEGLYRGWKSTEKSTPALTAKQAFMWVWDSTVKLAERSCYGWVVSPWVWVIEFERISREEAANGHENRID